jgi:hypothetical protein
MLIFGLGFNLLHGFLAGHWVSFYILLYNDFWYIRSPSNSLHYEFAIPSLWYLKTRDLSFSLVIGHSNLNLQKYTLVPCGVSCICNF